MPYVHSKVRCAAVSSGSSLNAWLYHKVSRSCEVGQIEYAVSPIGDNPGIKIGAQATIPTAGKTKPEGHSTDRSHGFSYFLQWLPLPLSYLDTPHLTYFTRAMT